MRRTSYQRGFVAGEVWAIQFIAKQLAVKNNPTNPLPMVESLGPVASVAGLVGKQLAGEDIAADDFDEWSEEELREERRRIFEALETAQYFVRSVDEAEANRRAFEGVPQGLRGGLRRYLDEHIPAGHFLMALLMGDLAETFARADVTSRAALFEIVSYLYNYAPAPAWGSKRKVELWLTPPIPIMDFGRPEGNHPKGLGVELVVIEGRTACPQCGDTHPVHHAKAEPGCVTFPGEGPTKKEHIVDYVWCQQVHLVVVGVDGLEVER